MTVEELLKPSMRGVLHFYAFLVTIALGVALVVVAPAGTATVAAARSTTAGTGRPPPSAGCAGSTTR